MLELERVKSNKMVPNGMNISNFYRLAACFCLHNVVANFFFFEMLHVFLPLCGFTQFSSRQINKYKRVTIPKDRQMILCLAYLFFSLH